MRAMIATTCFLLGAVAVLYSSGRGSNRHNNTHLPGGTSEALLLGQNQAALEVYEPCPDHPGPNNDPYGNLGKALVPPAVYNPCTDYCFSDKANPNKFCWYPTARFPYPAGQWSGDHGDARCPGPLCTKFADGLGPNPTYDPSQDFCFKDNANAGKYCWYNTDRSPYPKEQWEGTGDHGTGNCGPLCDKFADCSFPNWFHCGETS